MTDHPFVPGARVAIVKSNGWHRERFEEARVAKVHKTGRFTIEGSPAQYRPVRYGNPSSVWQASATGYHGNDLIIWDETTDARITAAIAEGEREKRLNRLADVLGWKSLPQYVTEDQVAAIEAALAPAQAALAAARAERATRDAARAAKP